LKEHGIEP